MTTTRRNVDTNTGHRLLINIHTTRSRRIHRGTSRRRITTLRLNHIQPLFHLLALDHTELLVGTDDADAHILGGELLVALDGFGEGAEAVHDKVVD